MLPCRIAQLRKTIGMNQLQLAQKLHVSASTIGMYEQGRRTPSIEILIQMSRIFNVSIDYLITGEEFTPSSKNHDDNITPLPSPCRNCCCQKLIATIRESISPKYHEPK